MASASFSIRKLTPAIGAEISGIDLNDAMNTATQDAIYQALLDNLVIFFRDQDITPERHLAFAKTFGTIDKPHPVYAHYPGYENIVVLENDAGNPADTNEWHTDVTFQQEPPFASILVAREVPDCGGDTLWASMYAAYDALSDRMKSYLEGLTALHDGEPQYRGRYADRGVDDAGKVYPRCNHPVVRTHPDTGRKCLFVNPIFTQRINDIPRVESDAILRMLHEHCASEDFQVRFRWQAGSVAFWDNRCAQHLAIWDYYPNLRSGFRVTIKGDRPR